MGQISRKDWARVLERDGGRCYHCGTTETLIPQHRLNRRMGGSKRLEVAPNVITLCSRYNGEIEANAGAASLALAMGWKVGGHPVITGLTIETLTRLPVYDKTAQRWYLLGHNYERSITDGPGRT